jgi:nitroreductase
MVIIFAIGEELMFSELVLKNRTRRRFFQDVPVSCETLKELVDLARLTPSSRNMQFLKYILSCQPEKNAVIFKHLAWAGYLKEWGGPVEGERPSAYIIILGDLGLSSTFVVDQGIVAQTILLGAVEKGLGGCMFSSINRKELAKDLQIPEQYEILLVIALGKPREEVVVDPVGPDGSIKYWRDEQQVHHVPKRALQDIILDL